MNRLYTGTLLLLLLCCISCSQMSEAGPVEVTSQYLNPSSCPSSRPGNFIDLQNGYQGDLVEILVNTKPIFAEKVSTSSALGLAASIEVEGQPPFEIQVRLSEHSREYRFEFDPNEGPCVGVSWDREQLNVEQYNMCPCYD